MIREEEKLHVILREPFTDSHFSGIVTYSIAPDGSLFRGADIMSTKGCCGCHLCSFQGKLYGVNYLSGSVFCSDGTLRIHEGRGGDDKRQGAPHPHYIAPSPDGKYLLVADLGLDRIFVYDDELKILSTAHLPQGAGPRHLANLDDGHVVCVNELNCSATMLTYADGVLTPLETISVTGIPEDSCEGCAAIRVCNNYIYISNRGDNTLSVIEAAKGKMMLLSSVSCGR